MRVPYVGFVEEFRQQRGSVLAAVTAVLERGDFILGDEVREFEDKFAALCGVKHAISVANGTDAILLTLRALGIGEGDEVITAANTWISTAAAIALAGARPVFADVESDQNISPAAIARAITPRTKAILPVHLGGRCASLGEILELGRRHGVPVIEDAAQAVTARCGDRVAGSAGTAGCFSLHPLKNLNAAGDAGVITTGDAELAGALRLLRHHGLRTRDEAERWGFNSRLDTLQAAVLLSRLPGLTEYLARRRAIAHKYTEALCGYVQCPIDTVDRPHTYHVYVIQTEGRNALREFLAGRGIETKVHYPIPIHRQPAARYLGYEMGSLPETERQAARILSLPVHPYLSEAQTDFVVASVRDFFEGDRPARTTTSANGVSSVPA